jgi:hypothetical protein
MDADRMLAAGLLYKGATLQLKGIPMMFSRSFAVHGGFVPRFVLLGRIQTLYRIQDRIHAWALERVVSASASSSDLRWMATALAVSALTALEAIIQRQLVRLARHIMGRALQGARFAGSVRTADSMVAAGGH